MVSSHGFNWQYSILKTSTEGSGRRKKLSSSKGTSGTTGKGDSTGSSKSNNDKLKSKRLVPQVEGLHRP